MPQIILSKVFTQINHKENRIFLNNCPVQTPSGVYVLPNEMDVLHRAGGVTMQNYPGSRVEQPIWEGRKEASIVTKASLG